jgi:ribonuclease HII
VQASASRTAKSQAAQARRASLAARAGGAAGRTKTRKKRRSAAKRRAPAVEVEPILRPIGYTPRRGSGLVGYERVLVRAGLGPVAGVDEAGRGACAGPLVVAAVALDRLDGGRWAQVADSKALTARAREEAYRHIVRSALAWHVVVIEPDEIDRRGLHVCNVAGMRRALAGLAASPGYVLTDGFAVPGLAAPALAMWKGDQVAVSVAAASIVAKVTRDKIMSGLHTNYPEYGFWRHKGYSTPSHMAALDAHGPSPVHRRSFVNVSRRLGGGVFGDDDLVGDEFAEDDFAFAAGLLDSEDTAWDGTELALVGSAGLDSLRDGPIVELIAGSAATPPEGGAGPRVRAPASSEGRT